MVDQLARIELFRFDPATDETFRYQEFRAPYRGCTVLDVLRYIYENCDSTVAFRWACSGGCCRSCIVSVNGKPTFACTTSAEEHMRVEPHSKFEIIKDLVVDFSRPKWETKP